MKFTQRTITEHTIIIDRTELIVLLTTDQRMLRDEAESLRRVIKNQPNEVEICADNMHNLVIMWNEQLDN